MIRGERAEASPAQTVAFAAKCNYPRGFHRPNALRFGHDRWAHFRAQFTPSSLVPFNNRNEKILSFGARTQANPESMPNGRAVD